MTDIVERLRIEAEEHDPGGYYKIAAAEIERVRTALQYTVHEYEHAKAEIERLRAKEERIAALEAERDAWFDGCRKDYLDERNARMDANVREYAAMERADKAEAKLSKAIEALEPFALVSSEGVVKNATGYVTITTCAEYFHRADATLKEIGDTK